VVRRQRAVGGGHEQLGELGLSCFLGASEGDESAMTLAADTIELYLQAPAINSALDD
jgi:hypothetical protein